MRCDTIKDILYIDQTPKPQDFGAWLKQHPEVQSQIKPINDRWGKISCVWHYYKKTIADPSDRRVVKTKTREYVICIDPKSRYAGNIYNNDSYGDLLGKFSLITPFRGYHAIGKVVYHAIIGIVKEILMGLIQKKPPQEIGKHIVKQIVDVFRTPYYEAILGGPPASLL